MENTWGLKRPMSKIYYENDSASEALLLQNAADVLEKMAERPGRGEDVVIPS